MANQLYVIYPYKVKDTWVFDDPERGLALEPFVEGIPEMINLITAGFPGRNTGFKLIFSDREFHATNARKAKLLFFEEDMGGAWYVGNWEGHHLEGWLCPALMKYFPEPPKEIWVAASPELS